MAIPFHWRLNLKAIGLGKAINSEASHKNGIQGLFLNSAPVSRRKLSGPKGRQVIGPAVRPGLDY